MVRREEPLLKPSGFPVDVEADVCLRPFTSLKAGGPAEWLARARSADELAAVAVVAQSQGLSTTYLGWGSNILPSDEGVPGLVVLNQARSIEVLGDGTIEADAGCGFQ